MARSERIYRDPEGIFQARRSAVDWRQLGTDPRYVEVRLNPRRAARHRAPEQVLALGPCLAAGLLAAHIAAGSDSVAVNIGFLATMATLLAVSIIWTVPRRSAVRVDPAGVVVRGPGRSHRVLWADLTDVVLDGYRGITLLTRDRVIACPSLACPERAWLPICLDARRLLRSELQTVREWLLSARLAATDRT